MTPAEPDRSAPQSRPETDRFAALEFTVTDADTAAALGSGDLAVLATPRVVAWCEAATCRVADALILADHQADPRATSPDAANADQSRRTSVGTRVAIEHLAASQVGERVVVQADLEHRDGRLVRFAVTAFGGADQRLIATGQVTRVIVDRDRFMARLAR